MKIAILLLAHKNKLQLERLLRTLNHRNFDIFVHLDAKASFSEKDILAPNVIFTQNRYDVGLFEFSMLQAERELIQTAKRYGNYGYYILLSGQCYPLVSMDTLHCELCKQYPKPFIEIVAPAEGNYVLKNFRHVYILKRFKLTTYAFLKKHFSYKQYRILRYIPGGFTFAVSAIKELLVKSPKFRLDNLHFPSYCGSQWWILPDTVIERVLPYFENREFCSIIHDTFSCDESFFQTAIMHQYTANGIHLDENGNYMNGRWFFIFHDGHPILLTCEQFEQMMHSGMFFARKFDIHTDSAVLDLIDQQILPQ